MDLLVTSGKLIEKRQVNLFQKTIFLEVKCCRRIPIASVLFSSTCSFLYDFRDNRMDFIREKEYVSSYNRRYSRYSVQLLLLLL